MKKILLCMASVHFLFGETSITSGEDQKAVEQAKTIRWKAGLFAGTVLLAVIAGIVVISIDGGTPNHPHRSHHHGGCHTQNP